MSRKKYELRLSDEERALLERAAERDRRSLASYIRAAALRAADETLRTIAPTEEK